MSNEYVAGHLEEALAQTGETDVHVQHQGDRLLITGNVATEVRRDAITAIADRLVAGLVVHNEVNVVRQHEPGGEEDLA